MNRLAIFVEGSTQYIFMRRLIAEVASLNTVVFEHSGTYGNAVTIFTEPEPSGEEGHYVLLYNCGSDAKVKSEILDQLLSLEKNGYSAVIGLVDVYPGSAERLAALEAVDHSADMDVDVIGQVMEMEAWFLGEHHHFKRWNNRLTYTRIAEAIGEDIRTLDFEGVPHPTKLLKKIYGLVGKKKYRKQQFFVRRVVDCLDVEHFYIDVRARSAGIDRLLGLLDRFVVA